MWDNWEQVLGFVELGASEFAKLCSAVADHVWACYRNHSKPKPTAALRLTWTKKRTQAFRMRQSRARNSF